MTIPEMSLAIKTLSRAIHAKESIVCGPGEQRDNLRMQIKEMYQQKRALTDARDKAIGMECAAAFFETTGGQKTITNEFRTPSEILSDREACEARSRAEALRQLNEMAELTIPRVF